MQQINKINRNFDCTTVNLFFHFYPLKTKFQNPILSDLSRAFQKTINFLFLLIYALSSKIETVSFVENLLKVFIKLRLIDINDMGV